MVSILSVSAQTAQQSIKKNKYQPPGAWRRGQMIPEVSTATIALAKKIRERIQFILLSGLDNYDSDDYQSTFL
jgi:hypothetical protein